jgi:hypothetical protein
MRQLKGNGASRANRDAADNSNSDPQTVANRRGKNKTAASYTYSLSPKTVEKLAAAAHMSEAAFVCRLVELGAPLGADDRLWAVPNRVTAEGPDDDHS